MIIPYIKELEETLPLFEGYAKALEGSREDTWRAFDTLKGWRTKEIEIKNMIIKCTLHCYLAKGIEVLRGKR